MTIKEIIEVLIIERNCVERQDTPLCDRNCANCDLVMPTGRVVKAYEQAIDILHQEPCDDAISREDALMCLTGMFKLNKNYNPEELISLFSKRIKDLPSVNPQASEHFIDGVHAMGYREGYKDAQKQ